MMRRIRGDADGHRPPLGDIRRTYRQEPGHKEALAVRLRNIDGEKTLQGVAELAYQQSFQV
jgi:hypothetical protein